MNYFSLTLYLLCSLITGGRIGDLHLPRSRMHWMLATSMMCRFESSRHLPGVLMLIVLEVNIHTDTLNESGFVECKGCRVLPVMVIHSHL